MNNHTYNIRWFIYLLKKKSSSNRVYQTESHMVHMLCKKSFCKLKAKRKRKRTRERMCFAFYALKDLYLLLLIKGARLKGSWPSKMSSWTPSWATNWKKWLTFNLVWIKFFTIKEKGKTQKNNFDLRSWDIIMGPHFFLSLNGEKITVWGLKIIKGRKGLAREKEWNQKNSGENCRKKWRLRQSPSWLPHNCSPKLQHNCGLIIFIQMLWQNSNLEIF